MTPFVKENLKFVLQDKKILLGITGSIAAFKACDIVRFLRNCGAKVRVVLTQGAENFVTRTTLETLSGFPVLSGFWEGNDSVQGTHHIDTARWADAILVAPATAHFIAKTALGLADDLLSTEILAFQGPLLIAPAMNPAMYAHPAVQENIGELVARKTSVLGPADGTTSCGEEGLGRMLEPEAIVEKLAEVFYSPMPMKKRRMLITLGPTRSSVDPVRFLSNRSSGMMGASLCWAAIQQGYTVTAICGPTQVELPVGMVVHRVNTAQEMAEITSQVWPDCDVFVGSAAVLDWEIKNPATQKLKKEEGAPRLDFVKSPDILAWVGENRTREQYVVAFAAETEDPIENAVSKMKRKGCDAIFVNDVSRPEQGFESSQNGGWWISATGQQIQMELGPKTVLARKLLAMIPSRHAM